MGSDEEEEEEEESDYETDSEDEQLGRQMLKPIFVPKKDRDTIAEREALEREEVAAMKREKVGCVLMLSSLCSRRAAPAESGKTVGNLELPGLSTCQKNSSFG